MDITYESVLEDLVWRDRNDSTRSTAPLKQAEDAVLLDTTDMTFDESVEKALDIISGRLGKTGCEAAT